MAEVKPLTPLVPKKRRLGRWVFRGLAVLFLLAVLVGYWQRQALYDWYKLRDYTPSSQIAGLATQDTMTAYARHMFYVNHPTLHDKTTFGQYCPSGTEQTVVLGCYKDGEQGIYLLNVTEPELAGIEQVTAAHETLHAAYARLSTGERNRVDAMLLDYYNHHLNDPIIKQDIGSYKKTEPGQVVNEMHSIFGTEVGNLPNDLEQYYARYFTNRATVVGYYNQYEAAFTDRLAQISQYDAQLSTWKTQIDQDEATLSSEAAQLSAQHNTLNNDLSSGNVDAYNAGIASYNQNVDNYNALLNQLKSLIDQYNQTVATRNAIAFEEQSLVQDITSSAPQPISK